MDDNKVAVLLENLQAQFHTFGEGLQIVNDKIDKMDQRIERVEQKVDKLEFKLDAHIEQNRREFERNHQDHLQLMQLIKDTDIEVLELKRIK